VGQLTVLGASFNFPIKGGQPLFPTDDITEHFKILEEDEDSNEPDGLPDIGKLQLPQQDLLKIVPGSFVSSNRSEEDMSEGGGLGTVGRSPIPKINLSELANTVKQSS